MNITLTHISLLAQDVPTTLRFYQETLGLEVINNYGDYAELKGNEQLKLSLFDRKAMEEALPTVKASAINGHRSVLEFKLDALDAFCDSLRSKGVQLVSEPTDRKDWGIRTAYIQDPDGNLINLFQSI